MDNKWIYQEELLEPQSVAIWAGDLENESQLTDYLGRPFETDFGFLLDQDDLPQFARSFGEPRLHAHYARPFLKVDCRTLLTAFSWAESWMDEAECFCRHRGLDSVKTVVVFPHLRYREELCRNSRSPLRFVGNVVWPRGSEEWGLKSEGMLNSPPFPRLVLRRVEESDSFIWKGRVQLNSWIGFASRETLAGESMAFRFTELPAGDYHLDVTPFHGRSASPTQAQARAFRHLLENEAAIRDAVLNAIFSAYPSWRESYYGQRVSSDGGKTYKTGWELPDMLPAQNMPEVGVPTELMQLIRLGSVRVLADEEDGFATILFGFQCKWDEEHGLGVLTHRGKVIQVD